MNKHYSIKASFADHFRAAGLEHVALLDARTAFDPAHSRWRQHVEAYLSWLRAGRAGSMGYLAKGAALRASPRHLVPGLAASFVFLIPYSLGGRDQGQSRAGSEPSSGILARIARYARSRDYHKVIKRRLHAVFESLQEHGFRYRVITDSVPFLDRAHAQMGGLGFVGRNTMMIRPGLGSYFFIASVLTDAEPEVFGWQAEPSSAVTRLGGWGCETCDLCVQACPTSALRGNYTMDANLCLSYLSIEHRGAVSDQLVEAFRESFFGCDICQEVCPYNLRPRAVGMWPEFSNSPRPILRELSLRHIALMEPADCEAWFGGLPLMRAKYPGLVRNALYALVASQDTEGLEVALTCWIERLARPSVDPAYVSVADVVSQVCRIVGYSSPRAGS